MIDNTPIWNGLPTKQQAQRQLTQGITEHSQQVSELDDSLRAMESRWEKTDDWQLEQRYVERAPSYFGRWLRQIDVLWPGRLNRKLEEKLDEHLNLDEKDEVLRLDAILHGMTQQPAAQGEIYVALEASVTVNMGDVERVAERAALLRRIGVRVVAIVAGEVIERDAEEYAQANAVAILRNGKHRGWEQALAVA